MSMSHRRIRCITAMAAALATTAWVPLGRAADNFVINTNTGVITDNGVATTMIGGVSVTDGGFNAPAFAGGDGAHRFIVNGDLTLSSGSLGIGDSLTAVGNAPLDLMVTNNVNIGLNASINVSGFGSTAGVGGGVGGLGGLGGGAGTGAPLTFSSGGGGGFPGLTAGLGLEEPTDGGPGAASVAGGTGGTGGQGALGQSGGVGANNQAAPTGTGTPGFGGSGGFGGGVLSTAGGTPGGRGADGFLAGTFPIPATSGGNGTGGVSGPSGTGGFPGGSAATANSGVNGTTNTSLTGGNGGAGGSGGGGGGGGAAGTSGAGGGGGGGGGYFATLPPLSVAGGSGGSGGDGGIGGAGGDGGKGGDGGNGGGGGGAIEIIAAGKINLAGNLDARGADGSQPAGNQTFGQAGASGTAGVAGHPGQAGDGQFSGNGGNGGNGGSGGNGAAGSLGGGGGSGGAGAGGTIKLLASQINGQTGSIDLGAGMDGDGNTLHSSDGRLIVGASTSSSGALPQVANGTIIPDTVEAPSMINPYAGVQPVVTQSPVHFAAIHSFAALAPVSSPSSPQSIPAMTPLIVADQFSSGSLVGGPAAFGLLPDGTLAADPTIQAAIRSAPLGAHAGLLLSPNGVVGFQNTWPGYEMLLLYNFGTTALMNPTLMGQALEELPTADQSAFGGSDIPTILSELDPGQVFAALVTDIGGTGNYYFNDGFRTFDAQLSGAGSQFDVPEPGSLAMLGIGAGMLTRLRRRKAGGAVPS